MNDKAKLDATYSDPANQPGAEYVKRLKVLQAKAIRKQGGSVGDVQEMPKFFTEAQLPWVSKALQAKNAKQNSIRWEKESRRLVCEIQKGLRKELRPAVKKSKCESSDWIKDYKTVNRAFAPAFRILWRARLLPHPKDQICGTCADWQTCRNTEGWRRNQPCSHQGGCFWRPAPNFEELCEAKNKSSRKS